MNRPEPVQRFVCNTHKKILLQIVRDLQQIFYRHSKNRMRIPNAIL